jgi:hypothetical protein
MKKRGVSDMTIEETDHLSSIIDDEHSLIPDGEGEQREKDRRQRHDRGPRLTARDVICLLWIAHQFAIRLDQLQRLLLSHTPERDRAKVKPGVNRLSLERTYDTLARWRALGLIEHGTILHGDRLWAWLSRAGLREIGAPFAYSKGQPASVRVPHLYYINQVRLAVEEKRPQDTWKSEREIRRELGRSDKGEQLPHIPDALLYAMSGKITAIEVERRLKNESVLEETLRTLAVSYRSVWYFASRPTKKKIDTMLETFTPEMRKPFVLYDLGEYGHEYGVS